MRRLVILVGLLTACAAAEPTLAGRASVIDGDTLELQGRRIRLWGIDTPEGRQWCDRDGQTYRCGQAAANQLDQHLDGRAVVFVQEDVDRYGRGMVARCAVDGADIGAWLVRHGHAVRYDRYAGASYLIEEVQARRDKAGVWAGAFEAPEDWRRRSRDGC